MENLSDELLILVCLNVGLADVASLGRLARVCRRFRAVANDTWIYLVRERFGLDTIERQDGRQCFQDCHLTELRGVKFLNSPECPTKPAHPWQKLLAENMTKAAFRGTCVRAAAPVAVRTPRGYGASTFLQWLSGLIACQNPGACVVVLTFKRRDAQSFSAKLLFLLGRVITNLDRTGTRGIDAGFRLQNKSEILVFAAKNIDRLHAECPRCEGPLFFLVDDAILAIGDLVSGTKLAKCFPGDAVTNATQAVLVHTGGASEELEDVWTRWCRHNGVRMFEVDAISQKLKTVAYARPPF